MERERFGRARGVGTREAAKALLKAADAAAAPNPNPNPNPKTVATPPAGARQVERRPAAAAPVQRAAITTARVKRGGRRFGEAVWTPLVKASGVLWLEVTGVLFGLFAAAAAVAVWRERGNFTAAGTPMYRAWFALGYFTISSYVRAARRQRR